MKPATADAIACLEADARLALSVRSQLIARGIPVADADTIAAACFDRSPASSSSREAKLERAIATGVDAWELWIRKNGVHGTLAGESRLSTRASSRGDARAIAGKFTALRPYRRQVVRLILEAIEHLTGVVWA